MAERLVDLVVQIRNVQQLEAVVTAMRGIAASRAQRGRTLLPGITAYSSVIARAIGRALTLIPGSGTSLSQVHPGKLGLILFCAEQGFAGAFSERVIDAVAQDAPQALILIVGTRGNTIAVERGLKPAQTFAMASHVDGIPALANRLAGDLYHHVAASGLSRVDIVLARPGQGGGIQIDRHSILPLDFGRLAQPAEGIPPLATLVPELLLERLAAEYVYAQLCEAAMYSFEAENEARMMAMAAANTNIATKLSSLSIKEKQLRQQEITTEIVELAAGAEASQHCSKAAGHRRSSAEYRCSETERTDL